jgi:hypothetical protein
MSRGIMIGKNALKWEYAWWIPEERNTVIGRALLIFVVVI